MTGDNAQALADCYQELVQIRSWILSNPFDTKSRFLISYAVIKSCGTLELVLKRFVCDYLICGANNEATTYLTRCIVDASFNPNTGNIERLLDSISPPWRIAFSNGIKGGDDKGALNSLITLRNDIAHGRSISASIDNVVSYFSSGKAILQLLWDIIHP